MAGVGQPASHDDERRNFSSGSARHCPDASARKSAQRRLGRSHQARRPLYPDGQAVVSAGGTADAAAAAARPGQLAAVWHVDPGAGLAVVGQQRRHHRHHPGRGALCRRLTAGRRASQAHRPAHEPARRHRGSPGVLSTGPRHRPVRARPRAHPAPAPGLGRHLGLQLLRGLRRSRQRRAAVSQASGPRHAVFDAAHGPGAGGGDGLSRHPARRSRICRRRAADPDGRCRRRRTPQADLAAQPAGGQDADLRHLAADLSVGDQRLDVSGRLAAQAPVYRGCQRHASSGRQAHGRRPARLLRSRPDRRPPALSADPGGGVHHLPAAVCARATHRPRAHPALYFLDAALLAGGDGRDGRGPGHPSRSHAAPTLPRRVQHQRRRPGDPVLRLYLLLAAVDPGHHL